MNIIKFARTFFIFLSFLFLIFYFYHTLQKLEFIYDYIKFFEKHVLTDITMIFICIIFQEKYDKLINILS